MKNFDNFSRTRVPMIFTLIVETFARETFAILQIFAILAKVYLAKFFIHQPEFCVFLRINSTFCTYITFTRENLSRKILRNSSLAKVYLGNFAIFFPRESFSRESFYD